MPGINTITSPHMFGFTPVEISADLTDSDIKPSLVFSEYNGATYDEIVTLQAKNEAGVAYWNISKLLLFNIIDCLPTFGDNTKPSGIIKKYKVEVKEDDNGTVTTLDTETDKLAIFGAYPPDLSFSSWLLDDTKFLSHMPRTQTLYTDQPFWLYYYAANALTVTPTYVAHYSDGSSTTYTDAGESVSAGEVFCWDVAQYRDTVTLDDLVKLEVKLGRNNGSELATTETFTLNVREHAQDWGVQYFLCFDKFGALVVVPAKGKRSKNLQVQRNFAQRDHTRTYNRNRHTYQQTQNQQKQTFKTSSGWLEDADYYQALFASEYVYLIDITNEEFIAINIENSSFEYHKDFENIINIDFEYSFMDQNYYYPR